MQYRHEIGHAPANLAFAAILTSSFALLAFSKYRRAQITPLTYLYCIYRFSLLTSTVLHFAGFRKYRRTQTTPNSDLYCRKLLYFFDYLQLLFCTFNCCNIQYISYSFINGGMFYSYHENSKCKCEDRRKRKKSGRKYFRDPWDP